MRNEIIEGYRLSPQQRHLWLLQQSAAFRAYCVVKVEGAVKPHALSDALRNVSSRHEILRTVFRSSPGMSVPLQVITEIKPKLVSFDLSDLNRRQQEARIEDIFHQVAGQHFDYEAGPIVAACLLSLSPDEHRLLICLPALCADKTTLDNLVRELSESYDSRSDTAEVPDEAIEYADVAEVLNELLESENTETGRAYWRELDLDLLADLKLPYDGASSDAHEFTPKSLSLDIPPDLYIKIEALAKMNRAPVSTLLLACWNLLLWRLSKVADISVAVNFSGRTYEGLEEALGLFARYVPVTCRFDGLVKFDELIRQVGESLLASEKRQDYFSWEQVGASGGKTVYPNICFSFETASADRHGHDAKFTILQSYECLDRFKIELRCVERRKAIAVEIRYDSEIYRPEELERLGEQYLTLLESVTADPELSITDFEIIGAKERRLLLAEFNDSKEDFSDDLCLHNLFERQVERTPSNVAVVFEECQLSYAELNSRANQLARHLRSKGVGPESFVGLLLERSIEMIVGVLGILKAGAAYLPLDPGYPKDRLSYMLADTRARLLVSHNSLLGILKEQPQEAICLDSSWSEIARQSSEPLAAGVFPDNAAYVIYTSGSTGNPKGVAISHRAIVNHMQWVNKEFPLTEPDKLLQKTSFGFDPSVWEFFAPLMAGATLIMAPPGAHQDSRALVGELIKHRVTILQLVPTMLKMMLEEPEMGNCESLRRMFCGGEVLSAESVARLFALTPAELVNFYGPTEATINATLWNCDKEKQPTAIPIGRPFANTQIYLLDEASRPVPIGAEGEIHIGGRQVARGYSNRPDLTAEKFIPDPFGDLPGARLYRTGDLARYRSDGSIEYVSRKDHQVKLRGYRIEMGEIEAVLCEHPKVCQAVAMVREDEPGLKRLVAYIVGEHEETKAFKAAGSVVSSSSQTYKETAGNGKLSSVTPQQREESNRLLIADLRDLLKTRLPEYMMPAAFVPLKSLPVLPNGKLNAGALPAPVYSRDDLAENYTAPRTETERVLAAIWEQVLHVDRVGIHDNFFEMGGDSILSIQIIARSNQAGIRLTPKQIFEHRTIAQLAEVAADNQPLLADQGLVCGPVALTPIQHQFFNYLLPAPHHWNMPLLLELDRHFSSDLIEEALNNILLHHDALRIRFSLVDGRWQQFNEELTPRLKLSVLELGSLNRQQQDEAIGRHSGMEQTKLKLDEAPLMRATVFRLGPARPDRLLLVIHHLIIDAVSWQIVQEDLQRSMEELEKGETVRLPQKTSSFKTWADHLSRYANSQPVLDQAPDWLHLFDSHSAHLPLLASPDLNIESSARSVSASLDPDTTSRLLKQVPKAFRSQIHETLVEALGQCVCRWAGGSSVLIDVEGHGREEIDPGLDLSRTVGWFTAIYPVLVEAGGTLGDRLKRIKEQMRSAQLGGIGYGLLKYLTEDKAVAEKFNKVPEAEISFNYFGQMQQGAASKAIVRAVEGGIGESRSGAGKRRYVIDVEAAVMGGKLVVIWRYSEAVQRREEIKRELEKYLEEVKRIAEASEQEQGGGYTPADFPRAKMNQQDLNSLLSKLTGTERSK